MGGAVPPALAPFVAAPAPVAIVCTAEPFKLPPIKDANAYNDLQNIIQYYLCHREFSTQRNDDTLITDQNKLEASCLWEGEISVAVQDGSLKFLFENRGSLYGG
jgi:hypothetical protein